MKLTNFMPENTENYRADFDENQDKHSDDISFLEPQIIEKKEEKKPVGIFLLLAVFALIAVVASAMQWANSIKLPFLINDTDKIAVTGEVSDDVQDLVQLQVQDTDFDGLSDYDELYLYNTSPYLEDTDSDGFNDSEEITNGYDPNCPRGAVCSSPVASEETLSEDLTNLTNEELRALLIQQGASPEQVASLDDRTLRETFEQTLGSIDQGDQFSNLISGYSMDLSPDEIKQVLIDQGINPEEVNQLTDEELTLIWQEALGETQTLLNQ
ncbi:hypothetical protein HOL24_10335 [bacterium]|jgi:hypothetical protein|nr:hypothetical protein [bacterium]